MNNYRVGDFVARKSYGGDIAFRITDINNTRSKPRYVLKGLIYRIQADSDGDDLEIQDPRRIYSDAQRHLSQVRNKAYQRGMNPGINWLMRLRSRPGKILHIDGDGEFLNKCLNHYREARLNPVGLRSDEERQPSVVRSALERYGADILVLTGHDGIKKESGNLNSIDNYANSRYFIEAVKEARRYEPDYDRLCIFAGACQSFYEGIMDAGANFASSPGRVLINAYDPAIVSEKVALTEVTRYVSPSEIAALTISGRDGIWGVNTKGHMTV